MDFFGWEDLDGDGHVDEVESLLADDLMCTNDEECEMNDGIGGLGPTSGAFGLESGLDGDVDEEFHVDRSLAELRFPAGTGRGYEYTWACRSNPDSFR